MIEIRPANGLQDIDEARRLFEEYASSLGFSLCFQGFDKELAGLPGEYVPPDGRLLLAFVDGKPAGCAALHRFAETDSAEMKRLYVRPEFRGQYLGKRLVEALIQDARMIGYRCVLLDTVVGKMDSAISLYRRNGFIEVESYRDNPMPGVIYMSLELAEDEVKK
ncbi:MAG TPA: GNAT family N-acetyltransferase [Terriglobales bacterium]|nr:GNAT family N-acetyltransferase [Terriglobales bacterium]